MPNSVTRIHAMSSNLIGVIIVVGFCVYAIVGIKKQLKNEDDAIRRKAIFFYGFLIFLAVLFFVISYLTFTSLPIG